jgi:hypothetical protein
MAVVYFEPWLLEEPRLELPCRNLLRGYSLAQLHCFGCTIEVFVVITLSKLVDEPFCNGSFDIPEDLA